MCQAEKLSEKGQNGRWFKMATIFQKIIITETYSLYKWIKCFISRVSSTKSYFMIYFTNICTLTTENPRWPPVKICHMKTSLPEPWINKLHVLRNTSRALKCHKPDISSIISSKDVYLYNISIWTQLCHSNVARSRDLPTFNNRGDLNLCINIINSFIYSIQYKYV